ncbi:DUF7576 family protein [Natronorubrum tibetense]|uniref:TRASH domain-containing protein n=1 Tax=Natronorubrum tibetense GA33 TaxID=1114856 RepID=L9VJU4_9EURY|nr:hypothetical protein [Natronorubrum tibetense]ELY37252.1 hypothetical protein C496_20485 [Natronorubrum tibetense GA33]
MDDQYAGPPRPSSHHRVDEPTACCTCGSEIGPDERRLTWRVRDGDDRFRYHYCSEDCLPTPDIELG